MKTKIKSTLFYTLLALTGVVLAQILNAFGITIRNTPLIFWGLAITYCLAQPILFSKVIKSKTNIGSNDS